MMYWKFVSVINHFEDLKTSDTREEQFCVYLQIYSLHSFCEKVSCAVWSMHLSGLNRSYRVLFESLTCLDFKRV